MLKIFWKRGEIAHEEQFLHLSTIFSKRGEIAHEEQFLHLSTIFSYLIIDFYVKTMLRFSLRDKRFIRDNRNRDNEGRLYFK